jgi:2-polyprenyl-3-methyl-5-hydroxy-6-metoxy-1,4-benzoquinol methylase
MEKIAIVGPASIKTVELAKRLRKFVPTASVLESSSLSNLGTHFDVTATHKTTAHIFSPLDSSFAKAFVVKEFPVLYANDFTLCWLVKILLDMGKGGELYIEIPNEKMNRNKNHITVELLSRKLPGTQIERADNNWIRIPFSKKLSVDIESLSTIYKTFHNRFNDFYDVWVSNSETTPADIKKSRSDATRTFIYSLFGANQKYFVLERIIRESFGDAKIDGLDMGGGYGFMAAELACAGHTMQMMDYNARNIAVGDWLARECGVENSLTLGIGNIEDISRYAGSYDLISYFGCLLYVDRKSIPLVIRASMALLKPGGVLIVHENPKGVIKPGSADYEKCFETEELIDYLKDNAGTPVFYNMFTANQLSRDQLHNKVVMSVVNKV